MRFLETHPEYQIQERYFIKLKPYYVKALKDRNVCCCRYHVELNMLHKDLNNLRLLKTGMHSHTNCQCNCGVCTDTDHDNENHKAHTKTYKGMSTLWEDVVCSKIETDLWHKYDCFMGLCNDCGVSKLPCVHWRYYLLIILNPFCYNRNVLKKPLLIK